jgi:protein SCO1
MNRLRATLIVFCAMAMTAPASAQMNLRTAQKQVAFDQRLGAQTPLDVRLRDESGKEIQLSDCLQGKPVVLHFAYFRCPGLCPLSFDGLTETLRSSSLKPGDEFVLLTISFDPGDSADTAAGRKQACLEQIGRPIDPAGWRFLTGGERETRRLAEAVGFRYAYDPAAGQYAHASGIVVLTPEGVVSRYLFGVDYGPRDLRLALMEASNGKIGSPIERVLLLCLSYDPVTGRYRFLAMTAVRIAGIATVLLIAALVIRSIIRERRRASSLSPAAGEWGNERTALAGEGQP